VIVLPAGCSAPRSHGPAQPPRAAAAALALAPAGAGAWPGLARSEAELTHTHTHTLGPRCPAQLLEGADPGDAAGRLELLAALADVQLAREEREVAAQLAARLDAELAKAGGDAAQVNEKALKLQVGAWGVASGAGAGRLVVG
jgi:hypothetical protein